MSIVDGRLQGTKRRGHITSARQGLYPGNLSANTSAFSIFGGCTRRSGAFSINALATFAERCASRPASSGNASKMAKVVGPSLIPNQAVVAGSCWTKPCPSRRNFATSFSFPGFASSLTNNAFVVMGDLLVTVVLSNCRNRIYLSVSVGPNEIPSVGRPSLLREGFLHDPQELSRLARGNRNRSKEKMPVPKAFGAGI